MPATFPETQAEAAAWEPTVARRALSVRVLVVAATRIEGAWCAYCDAVPGENHDHEWQEVLRHGVKLPEAWARPMFPTFDDIPYAK